MVIRGSILASVVFIMLIAFVGCEKDKVIDDTTDIVIIDTLIIDSVNNWVYAPTEYVVNYPSNFPPPLIPIDNPLTVNGVSLGRRLFYDPILSEGEKLACAGCHNQEFAFTDNGLQYSKGVDGIEGGRNTMASFNMTWQSSFFWDGRAPILEEQILQPVENPVEMNESWDDNEVKLRNDTLYHRLFFEAFGIDSVTIDRYYTAKAIAQFLRSIVSGNSKYDKFVRNELFGTGEVWTDSEDRGLNLVLTEPRLGGGDCFHCHNAPLFQDVAASTQFRNNGLQDAQSPGGFQDGGRGEVTNNNNDYGKFKAPTLRNIELTAPYMHDGRFATLEEVIEFYNQGIHGNSMNIDPIIQQDGLGDGLNLSAQDKLDLIAFLKTLTDNDLVTNPDYSDPF